MATKIYTPQLNRNASGVWVLGRDPNPEPFTVAVVGNAQSLFGRPTGPAIDDHDVVIRMNRAAMLVTEMACDHSHGSRTDVWCVWRHREYEEVEVDPPATVCQMSFWAEPPDDPAVTVIDNTAFAMRHTYPQTPSTGLMVLAWLAQMPAQVSVYGFDWKQTPTFTDPDRTSEQHAIHDFELERKLCQTLFVDEHGFEFK